MRFVTVLLLIATMTVFSGCTQQENKGLVAHESAPVLESSAKPIMVGDRGSNNAIARPAPADKTSTESLAATQAQTQATERKIIQNAELTIELDSPENAQRSIASITQKHGGFIVTAEAKQNRSTQAVSQSTLTIIARVPAARFNQVIEEIEKLGGNVIYSKQAGQDVTEEYIDLEARIRAKQALESQFLEIMKRAAKVSDALEVQKEMSEVRSEIERLEGRRRFLENQSALSTITVTLQTPAPIVAATTGGFWQSIKLAFGDGLDTAAGIVLGLIRSVFVLIPIVLLIILPGLIIFRWLRRKIDWPKRAEAVVAGDSNQ